MDIYGLKNNKKLLYSICAALTNHLININVTLLREPGGNLSSNQHATQKLDKMDGKEIYNF